MLRTILVGLDESPYSAAAVDLGMAWAQRFNALLVGVGVIDEPTIRGPQPEAEMSRSYRVAYDQMIGDARRRVDQLLDKFSHRATEAAVSHKLLEDSGLPCEQIMLEAQRYDIVLLGRHTYFHFETSSRACATLDKVLKNAPRPVVTVPKENAQGKGVLIAYDGSPHAARALHAYQSSGLAALGDIHVLTLHPKSAVDAARTANRAVEYLAFHDIQATSHSHVTKDPAGAILDQGAQLGVELMVMGAFGQNVVKEFFLGSVTKHVLDAATVPLFLCH